MQKGIQIDLTWLMMMSVFALAITGQNSYAKDDIIYGPAVDSFCTGSGGNGTRPYADYDGPTWDSFPSQPECGLCHGPGINFKKQPEFDGWKNGVHDKSTTADDDFSLFCPPETPINQPPIANDDAAQTDQGVAITIDVLGNDTDADGDALSISSVGNPGHGAVVQNGLVVTYTPAADFTGSDSFTYQASDGKDDSNVATVAVTVMPSSPGNTAPQIISKPVGTATVGFPYQYAVEAADPDTGDMLLYALLTAPLGMTIDAQTGLMAWTPSDEQTGENIVGVQVMDTGGLADNQSFTVTVKTVGLPTACRDADGDLFSADGGGCGPVDCRDTEPAINPGISEVCGDGIDNDCDGAVDELDSECSGADCLAELFFSGVNITAAVWNADNAMLVVAGERCNSGSAVHVSNADTGASIGNTYVQEDGTWELQVSMTPVSAVPCRVRAEIDGHLGDREVSNAPADCDDGVNQAPLAVADAYSTYTGQSLAVSAPGVLGNDSDADGGALSARLVDDVAHGVLAFREDGAFTYTPDSNFLGTDGFSYTANDGLLNSNVAAVSIEVKSSDSSATVSIAKAEWSRDKARLRVEGEKASPVGAQVTVSNAGTGEVLDSTTVQSEGKWRVDIFDPAVVPCRVRVTLQDEYAEREVNNAPYDCDGGANLDITISKAEWNSEKGRLRVEGEKDVAGAEVTVSNAATGTPLGSTLVQSDGKWRVEVSQPAIVPCRVRVTIQDRVAERDVEHTPANCDQGDGGVSEDNGEVSAQWNSEQSALKVKGEGFPSGTRVSIFNAVTDQVLGTADESERGDGGWRFKLVNPNPVPCRILVEVDSSGQVFEESVEDAPADCL